MDNPTLLRVRDLRVSYLRSDSLSIPALRDVSFDLQKGEVVGLLGESGCGKTTLALSVLHILPGYAVIQSGTIRLGDIDLLAQGGDRRRPGTDGTFSHNYPVSTFRVAGGRPLAARDDVGYRTLRF